MKNIVYCIQLHLGFKCISLSLGCRDIEIVSKTKHDGLKRRRDTDSFASFIDMCGYFMLFFVKSICRASLACLGYLGPNAKYFKFILLSYSLMPKYTFLLICLMNFFDVDG